MVNKTPKRRKNIRKGNRQNYSTWFRSTLTKEAQYFWVRLNYVTTQHHPTPPTTTHHHPPPSKIYPPQPTTSQNTYTTTNHGDMPAWVMWVVYVYVFMCVLFRFDVISQITN